MRTKKSFFNMITSIVSLVVIGVLGFIKIRYFIDLLGSEANGLIQMIYRILSYLSLAELGLGGAILYKLYKPLADKDEKQISKIISTATYFFNRIGIFIIGFLVVFMFVIPFLIKGNTYEPWYLYIVFFLAGLPYAIEYLWYKKYYILIAADQNQHINNIIFNSSTIIYDILIIIALTQKINIIEYILISYPFIIYKGLFLHKIFKKKYSYVVKTKDLDKSSIEMSKDVFIHNIGSAINSSADQIVLSIFNGLTFVSIYSSYFYIVKYLKDITNSILKSSSYSFGNLFSNEAEVNKKSYDVFKEYLSFSSFLAIIVSSTFFIAILPFINVWINNPAYVLKLDGIIAFTLLVYINIITLPINTASGANGIFKETKYFSFMATIVNVALSLLVIKRFQISGIVLATVFSTMFIWFPLVLNVIYKKVFNEHTKMDYYKQIIISLFIVVIIAIASKLLNISSYYSNNLLQWILISGICFVLISIITFIFYYLTDEFFRKFVVRCKNLFKRRKK